MLLRHATGLSRAGLLQRLADPAGDEASRRFEACIQRRLRREPSAYITGHREFFGLDFLVTPATLIPRPETETLVEAALALLASAAPAPPSRPQLVVDVGTGSGAIAIAIAKFNRSAVFATDSSAAALETARENAGRLDCVRRIVFRRGDLLDPLDAYVDLIAANLPYVRTGDLPGLQPEVRDYEPRLALAAGEGGLDCIRRLLRQAPRYLRPGGAILLEFGFGQEHELLRLAQELVPGAVFRVIDDLAGNPRVLQAQLP